MREIKFRCWNYLEKAMYDDDDLSVVGGYYYDNGVSRPLPECEDEWSQLMQYTGLKDRNGVEIYEGDIVKTWHPFSKFDYNQDKQEDFCTGIWLCEWEAPKFIFNSNDKRCIGKKTGLSSDLCAVIGNIYENKEQKK